MEQVPFFFMFLLCGHLRVTVILISQITFGYSLVESFMMSSSSGKETHFIFTGADKIN